MATVQHGLRLATPGLADRGPVRALLVDGTVVRMRELDEADAQDVALFYRGRSSASRPAGGSDVLRQHLSSDATPGTSGPSGPWRPRPTLPSSRFRRGRVLMSDEQAPALEALSGVECYRLLATAQVGRLGVHAHRYPLIFPSTTHSTGRRSSYERSRVRSSALPTTRMSPSRSTTSIHGRAAGGACSSGESPRRSPLLVPAGRRWASGPAHRTPGRRTNAGALDTHHPARDQRPADRAGHAAGRTRPSIACAPRSFTTRRAVAVVGTARQPPACPRSP